MAAQKSGESALTDKREKVMLDLDRLKKYVLVCFLRLIGVVREAIGSSCPLSTETYEVQNYKLITNLPLHAK